MAYTPTRWVTGDKVTSAKLNKIENGIADKVDKVSGKVLSTNDYTNADKKKVDDISISSPTNGQALVYNSSTQKWENKTINDSVEELEQAVNNIASSLPQQLSSVADLIGYDLLTNNFQTGAYSSSGVTPNTGRAYCIYSGVSMESKIYFDNSKYLVNYYYVNSAEDLTNLYTPNVWDDTGEITLRYMDNGVVFVAVKRVGSSAYLADLIDDINRSVSVFNLEGTNPNYNGVVTGTTLASNDKLGFYSIGGYSTAVVSSMTDMPCDDFAGGYLLNTHVGSAGTSVRQTIVEINSGTTLGRTFSRTIGYDWVGVGYVNWVAFGDSITHGSYSTADGQTLNNSKYSYAFRIAKNLRHDAVSKLYNCAVRGIGWVNTGNNGETFADMMALFTGDKTAINLVTIMLGINDYISNETLGTTSSAENDGTISGAIRYGLRYLCENYPNAKIIAISPLNSMNHGTAATGWSRNTRITGAGTLQQVCDMIAYWCNIYNVTYINEISESFLNNYNMPTYLKDNLHPTDEGQWMLARELSEKIFTSVSSRDGTGGQDGYSPTVTVTNITNGHRVSITDATGTKTFDVMNGSGGSGGSGQDGFSPTVAITDITGGHRVSITDVDGTKTFDVMDGTNGTDGSDGFSPTVTVTNITNGHRVSITDATGTKTFDVMNGSGSGGGTVTEVYYATPEDYGASGDGVTDDSSAIQQAINSGKPVNFSHKTYFIHSTITINNKDNWSMNAQDATFVYDGTNYAFQILYVTNSQINIGTIKANNGGGIKFYSANKDSFNQYINLTFNCIECETNCIYSYAESGGWCNENRIFGGRFAAGENGVNISHADGNETDGWKFYDCGIEGVTNGFLFNAGSSTQGRISAIAIINPRYAESYTTVLKTVGRVFDCLWVGTCVFKPTEIDCSETTSRFEIAAPIGTIWDEGVYRHRGCITNGELIAEVTLYDGQTPTSIDTTLTVRGAAADAKAVGDKFDSIFIEEATNNIFNKDAAVTGSYVNPYTGEIVSYNGVFHAFIELQVGTYTFLAQHGIFGGNAYAVAMFDENYNFVSYTEGTHTEVDSMNSIVTVTFSSQAVSTAKYFSINGTTDILNTLMIVKGTEYPTEYIEYGTYKTIDGLQITKSQIIDLDDEANPLKGKIISLNGDSIVSGVGYQGGYGKIIAEENGMTYENVAVGGGTVAYVGENVHCISRTIANMRADADYIILDGGGNDADSGVPLGTLSTGYDATLDDTTFAGAFENMLKTAIARFPNKKIGYVFIHKCAYLFSSTVKDSYYDIAKSACEKWGIPYCDLNTQTPPLNYIANLKTNYTANGDGYHPNEQGYKLFYVPKITAWLKTL